MTPKLPPPCQGQMVSYAHKEDAREYQLYDTEGTKCCKAILCSLCVKEDRRRGFDWRSIEDEGPFFKSIDNGFTFYENKEDQ